MVDVKLTAEFTLTEEIVEHDTRSHRNRIPKRQPSPATIVEGVDEVLDSRQ